MAKVTPETLPGRITGWTKHLRNAALLGSVSSVALALFTYSYAKYALAGAESLDATGIGVANGMLVAAGFFTATNLWFTVSLMGFSLRAAQLVAHRGQATRLKPGWAIGGWFIPIGQLVLPYLMLVDVVQQNAGQEAASRRRSVLWFWIWYVVLNQLAAASIRNLLSADPAMQFQGYQLYAGALAFNIVPLMMARRLFPQLAADLIGEDRGVAGDNS